jgi:hypothetical protein
MSDSTDKKDDTVPQQAKHVPEHEDDRAEGEGTEDERMEDEEKILAGRNDVNYPALLTKDVPGG